MMEWEMHPATQPATIAYKQLLAKVVNKNVGQYEYKKLQVQRQYLRAGHLPCMVGNNIPGHQYTVSAIA